MGLDMYLEARLYLPPYSKEFKPIREAIGRAIGYTPPTEKLDNDSTLMEITGVTVRVGYWRKLTSLHRWFVNNAQDGHDDCRPAYVTPKILVELTDRIGQGSVRPESVGDHFANHDDDSMTKDCINYTLKVMAHAKRFQERGWDIYYRSSW